jgi:hypothetical protein
VINPTRVVVALVATTFLSLAGLSPTATAAAPAPATTQRHLVDIPAEAALARAVAPSECGATLLDAYVDELIGAMTREQLLFVIEHQDTLLTVPTYDALFG